MANRPANSTFSPSGGQWYVAPVTLVRTDQHRGAERVKLGPINMKVGRLEYRCQKTAKTIGVLAGIPAHPDPANCLSDRPFLATAYGKSRSPDGLGNLMRDWCDKAGLSECSAHGLRKACVRRLAEAGAAAHEIMANTGRNSYAEVQRYTETAMRDGLADAAHAKLLSRPNREQTVVNLPHRSAIKYTKSMKPNDK